MMKCYICDCFVHFAFWLRRKVKVWRLLWTDVLRKLQICIGRTFPTGIKFAVCFKYIFNILRICYYQRSESVKDMLNDCCDKIRDYQKKSNCLKAIHAFFDDGFNYYFIFVLHVSCRMLLLKHIRRDLNYLI